MARTPTAVLRTVGHMAQTAMVKSAANSLALLPALAKSTTPSGIQAKGDTFTCWINGQKAARKLAPISRKLAFSSLGRPRGPAS